MIISQFAVFFDQLDGLHVQTHMCYAVGVYMYIQNFAFKYVSIFVYVGPKDCKIRLARLYFLFGKVRYRLYTPNTSVKILTLTL